MVITYHIGDSRASLDSTLWGEKLSTRATAGRHVDGNELSSHAYGSKLAQGLELIENKNGNKDIPFAFLMLFWEFSDQANQTSLTIHIPTAISGFVW